MTQVCSVFSQLLQLFSRGAFARAVKEHSAERNAKGFTCRGQFVAMLFCQVAQLKSLREVCMGLASCEAPLKHLGISETPNKSTLAYANEHRPWELYQTIFGQLLEKCQAEVAVRGGRQKFRFQNKLLSLDGSIIDLSASMFDWAKYKRTKGAIKLHLLLDHNGYLPSFAVVTEGKHSEVAVARGLRLEPGTILVIDRGYNDYEWFAEMTGEGVFFVTRMKTNTVYAVEAECEVPEKGPCCETRSSVSRHCGKPVKSRCCSDALSIGMRTNARSWCSSPTCCIWPPRPLPRSTRTAGRWNCFSRR